MAILADLNGDGKPEILLFTLPAGIAAAFKSGDNGQWTYLGQVTNTICKGAGDALRTGQFKIAAPHYKEIEAAGQRLSVNGGCNSDRPEQP